MTYALKGIAVVLLLMLSHTMDAQKIVTDRPDQTESSSTIVKGSLQIESGIQVGFAENDQGSLQTIAAPSTLFRYGLTKSVEIRVVNQYLRLKNKNTSQEISGISDLELGAKVQIFKKEDVNTEIAFLSHVVLPTGTKDISLEKVGTINKLSIAHAINNKMGLGYNIGYNYFGVGHGFLTYSLAWNIEITEKAGIYIEPYGEMGIFEEHLANVDAGFTYLLEDNFQLDFSFGTGMNYTMNYISAGFSWNIGT